MSKDDFFIYDSEIGDGMICVFTTDWKFLDYMIIQSLWIKEEIPNSINILAFTDL